MVARELLNILLPAYPCPSFGTACKSMRYDAGAGLFPRGYGGATGQLQDVDLVLVIAEPGEPGDNARSQPQGEPSAVVEEIATYVGDGFRSQKSAFHRNVHFLLECCWPDLSFGDRLRRTWITEGVLCSASQAAARVPRVVETACADRYLAKQLAQLPNAFVIAVGTKARRRLKIARRPADFTAFAAGLPGANSKRARPSWQEAGRVFREHLNRRGKA